MSKGRRGFASDNAATVHPAVLESIAKANVEFFGYRTILIQPKVPQWRVDTTAFAEFSDQDGQIILDGTNLKTDHTWLITARSSQQARFSSRCDLSGVRSPACSATDQPFRTGRSLASADTYFPACSHVCVRTKHDRRRPIRTDRSSTARRAPMLAAAAAPLSFVLTSS